VTHRRAALAILVGLGLAGAACSSTSSPSSSPTTTQAQAQTQPTTVKGAAGVLGGSANLQTPSAQLTGAGANSAAPFFQQVFYEYNKANPKVSVTYTPSGSSVGISDIQQNTVSFGQTEIPMSSSDLAKATAGPILQVPVDLGGTALSFNVPGIKHIKLDGPTLAEIYLGTIKKWNDSKIKSLNPGVNLPDLSIVPVHRADSSGPGWNLDQYLITTAPQWSAKVGTKASKSWPVTSVGVGQQLNTGVANYIAQTSGAIGYVEYGYAKKANFTDAALKNKNGTFVVPTISSIKAAGANATHLSSTNFSIINGSGGSTYPLANFSWTLIYQKQSNTDKGEALGKVFDWVITTGQSEAPALGYAPLPSNVVALAHNTLLMMQTSSGSPLFSH
jgi:phosphate transport system substrate-binding protein